MADEHKVRAPWTDAQVDALNLYQEQGWFHPFTCCGIDSCRDRLGTDNNERKLVATKNGWICPTCDHKQDWAWEFMFGSEATLGIPAREVTPY